MTFHRVHVSHVNFTCFCTGSKKICFSPHCQPAFRIHPAKPHTFNVRCHCSLLWHLINRPVILSLFITSEACVFINRVCAHEWCSPQLNYSTFYNLASLCSFSFQFISVVSFSQNFHLLLQSDQSPSPPTQSGSLVIHQSTEKQVSPQQPLELKQSKPMKSCLIAKKCKLEESVELPTLVTTQKSSHQVLTTLCTSQDYSLYSTPN